MTLSVHCHMCPLCCPFPPAVPAVPASCLGVLSGSVVMPTGLLSHVPFQICYQNPYFPKGAQGKGQLAKAA